MLAKELRSAVFKGNVRVAYAAKGALITGIIEIRRHIPEVNPQWVVEYINNVVKYLETWVLLVNHAHMADETERNLKNEKEQVALDEKELNESKDELKNRLVTDCEFNEAFIAIQDGKEPRDFNTGLQVRTILLTLRSRKNKLEFNRYVAEETELLLMRIEIKVDYLHAKVNALPIPEGSNKIEIDEQVGEVDDTLTMLKQHEAALKALEASDARQIAANEAEKFLEEWKAEEKLCSQEQDQKENLNVEEVINSQVEKNDDIESYKKNVTDNMTTRELAVDLFGEEGTAEIEKGFNVESE